MKRSRQVAVVGTTFGLISTFTLMLVAADAGKSPSAEKVASARKEVKMLDDLYKTAVVLITKHYVNDKQTASAGTAAKLLFKSMKEKGHHDAKILDATGKPYNDENVASDDFEKDAIKQLKAGKSFVEQVVSKDGKHFFRAATPVPVVMDKCILCHENYRDVKAGTPIGALVYTLPIE